MRARILGLVVVAVTLLICESCSAWPSGPGTSAIGDVWNALFAPVPGNTDHVVVRELRVPRTVIGVMVGLALALAGTVMQGITRNPLADPGLLGVNAGASLFVVLAISLLGITNPAGFVWFAFAGAAAAASIVYGIGAIGRQGATGVGLVLAGVALTAGVTSIITLVLITQSPRRSARFGSGRSVHLAARDFDAVVALGPFLLVGTVLAFATGGCSTS